jgi:ADP-dependent phosphofructokinase/glucokinase
MDWVKEYRKSVEYARWHITDSAIFAYNTNIDAVKHLKGKDVGKIKLPFNSSIKKSMQNGEQKEIGISKKELEFLVSKLGYDSLRMGGQAGNMANAASYLGVNCFVNVSKKTKEQLALFEKPRNVFIAHNSDFKNPDKVAEAGKAPTHYVIEFKKGEKIDGRKIPNSNRFIASFNPNSEIEVEDEFRQSIPKRVMMIDKALISGFHNLNERSDYKKKIKKVEAQLWDWKMINPHLKIHLEFGEFQSKSVLKFVLKELLPVCNSAGFNEIELDEIMDVSRMKFKNIVDACERICAITGRVAFHCENYSFTLSVGRESKLYQLLFASLLAAHKVAKDKHATFKELLEFAHSRIRINESGLKEIEKLSKMKTKFSAHFAPALLVEEPKTTVGAGDCFTAGYFLVD